MIKLYTSSVAAAFSGFTVVFSVSFGKHLLFCLYQDIQGQVPSHLLRLKVEVEQNRVAAIIEDCRAELDREMQVLSDTCTSEQVIQEHRVRFGIYLYIYSY